MSAPRETIDRWTAVEALLSRLDRPAAVVAPGGQVLAANAAFREMARAIAGSWPVPLEELLAAGERALFHSVVPHAVAPETWPVGFVDGRVRTVCAEVVPGLGGSLVTIEAEDADSRLADGEARLRHDVAGPLTAILGTAEVLLMRGGEMPAEVRAGLERILAQCARIAELLAVSRAQSPGGRGGRR